MFFVIQGAAALSACGDCTQTLDRDARVTTILYEDMRWFIIIAKMAVFNVAGYFIEERRRWPVIITASPRGQYSK